MDINFSRRFCLAPMLDLTDKHFRYLCRLISSKTMLYTEMINENAIFFGDDLQQKRLLDFSSKENPITLQVGGNCEKKLSYCAKMAEKFYYDEINLNLGCPSDRVQSGNFGLSLMKNPNKVKSCIQSLKSSTNIPVSLKCRIGYDYNDSYSELCFFIEKVIEAKIDFVCIHARKGWLKGLSPKQNRNIPPLNYDVVYKIKKDFPNLKVGINGGINNTNDALKHLEKVDSVMVGRALYNNPFLFLDVDNKIYNIKNDSNKNISNIIKEFLFYTENELSKGIKLSSISRHLIHLFNGKKGSKLYRQYLSQNIHKRKNDLKVIEEALNFVDF